MRAVLGIVAKLLRDPSAAVGLLIILLLVAIAILAPLLATHPDAVWNMNPRHRLQPPSESGAFAAKMVGQCSAKMSNNQLTLLRAADGHWAGNEFTP